MLKLNKITVKGFKSIDADGQSIEFGDVTVFIGPNGAGKSNLVSFFKMLHFMMTGSLQTFVGQNGFASMLLHYGPDVTRSINANIELGDELNTNNYRFTLTYTDGNRLMLAAEEVPYHTVAGNGRAEELKEHKRHNKALTAFSEIINLFPNNAVARNGIAEVLKELGRLDDALTAFSETIDRFPDNVVARCGRAEVLRELGRLDDALTAFSETIDRFPDNVVARCGRAEVLKELGRFDEALYDGQNESSLRQKAAQGDETCRAIHKFLSNCQVFQFYDTSPVARIRNQCLIGSDAYLYPDAGNLAAILYAMANNPATRKYYERIIGRIAKIFPQFRDFELSPSKLNDKYVLLNYLEKDSDYIFGPSQLSDGTLRFMALTTLLLQPPKWLPNVIIIDEPELGLHPVAVVDLASMVRTAAEHSQVILCTQSTRLLDALDDKEIVVVEHDEKKKSSTFKRLDKDDLSEWLSRYSVSELLDKNVFGGNP
jgi:predicted ATPase